jgi:hypothetical protein
MSSFTITLKTGGGPLGMEGSSSTEEELHHWVGLRINRFVCSWLLIINGKTGDFHLSELQRIFFYF